MEKENKPGVLIKDAAEILVRDGCDVNFSVSSEDKENLINSRDI